MSLSHIRGPHLPFSNPRTSFLSTHGGRAGADGALPPRSTHPGWESRLAYTCDSCRAGTGTWHKQEVPGADLLDEGGGRVCPGVSDTGGLGLNEQGGSEGRGQEASRHQGREPWVLIRHRGHSLGRGGPTSRRRTSSRRRWWSQSTSATRRPWAPSSTTCAVGRTPTGCGAGLPGDVSGQLHPPGPLP